jgi:ankyrin repeat protein/arylsulfatase A-like enzyme
MAERHSAAWVACQLVVLLGSACGILSCSDRPPADAARSRFNLIVISIDTLRADRLGSYGYARPTSPAIDRFAERGVRFARAFAESSWTLPSHMTLMTGLAPSRHGVVTEERKLNEQIPVLAEVLHNAGYRTYAFTAGGLVGPTWGFGRGFEEYSAVHRQPLERVLALARERIASFDAGTSYFLFLHTYDVHSPYNPPESYAQMFRTRPAADALDPELATDGINHKNLAPGQMRFLSDQYDAGIRAADDQLGAFFAWLEQRGAFDDTVVILLSDHGEELGEHRAIGHGFSLYVQTLHIPLIVVAPGIAPRVVQQGAGLADVLPTALELLGIGAPAVQGQSLVATMRGSDGLGDRPLFSELDRQQIRLRSVVHGKHHLITSASQPPSVSQLFDLESDPVERYPIGGLSQSLGLDQLLVTHVAGLAPAQAPSQPTIAPAVAERLRALGYADEPPRERPTPGADLIAPARAGDTAAVARLLDGGVDVNARDAGGETALIAAAAQGHDEIVELLLSHHVDVDAIDDLGTSALVSAAEQGHQGIVQRLLAHGAKVDSQGTAPLVAAADKGRTPILRLLLDANADRNVRGQAGKTALQQAAAQGFPDAVALLLSRGADPNMGDFAGVTPLIAAARHGDRETVALLLANGAAANAKSGDGATALLAAAAVGDPTILSGLLAHGAEIDARQSDGKTALIEAASAGKADAVTVLIGAGANVNAKAADGSTALLAATSEEAVQIVEFLLAHGADVRAKADGNTALHIAVEDGNAALVEVLLANGADPQERNDTDETALEAAEDLDSGEIARMLESAVKARQR